MKNEQARLHNEAMCKDDDQVKNKQAAAKSAAKCGRAPTSARL